jgi:hypothetical protein
MELVSYVGLVEPHFCPFGDSVCVSARLVNGRTEHTIGIEKSFRTHSMGLLGDEAQVEALFGPFGDSATLVAGLVHSFR